MVAKVLIERDKSGYSAYIPEDYGLPYGISGDGKTVQEAKDDFMKAYDEMRDFFKKQKLDFPEVSFEFSFDIPSFLAYYSDRLSLAGLERITGVAQGQLSHYVTGRRSPSPKTVEKIQKALNEFGAELSHLSFK